MCFRAKRKYSPLCTLLNLSTVDHFLFGGMFFMLNKIELIQIFYTFTFDLLNHPVLSEYPKVVWSQQQVLHVVYKKSDLSFF